MEKTESKKKATRKSIDYKSKCEALELELASLRSFKAEVKSRLLAYFTLPKHDGLRYKKEIFNLIEGCFL